jgi:hypothetical protein
MHEVLRAQAVCLLEQETQTNPLFVASQGLLFVSSNDVIYDGPGFDNIYY